MQVTTEALVWSDTPDEANERAIGQWSRQWGFEGGLEGFPDPMMGGSRLEGFPDPPTDGQRKARYDFSSQPRCVFGFYCRAQFQVRLAENTMNASCTHKSYSNQASWPKSGNDRAFFLVGCV